MQYVVFMPILVLVAIFNHIMIGFLEEEKEK